MECDIYSNGMIILISSNIKSLREKKKIDLIIMCDLSISHLVNMTNNTKKFPHGLDY